MFNLREHHEYSNEFFTLIITDRMNTIICQSPGDLHYISRSYPQRGVGESIIHIKRVGICGTDLHAFDGTQPYFSYPRVLGHELAATYVEGDAPGFSEGDPLTVIPYVHCGRCIACRQGKTNCCATLKVLGVHVDGGMTEYFSVPSHLLVHANGCTLDQLALVEPLSIGAHAVTRAAIKHAENVLVVGAGPIGLGVIQFALRAGAHVIVMDTNDDRLHNCSSHFNELQTINSKHEDIINQLKDMTGGDMPSVVMDATGNLNAINNAFSFLSHAGRYILVGLQLGEITVSHPEFHKREATLMSSRNATRSDFEQVMQSIIAGNVDVHTMITHRISFGQLKEKFSTLADPNERVIKALVEFD